MQCSWVYVHSEFFWLCTELNFPFCLSFVTFFLSSPKFGPAEQPWKAGEPKLNKFVFIGKGLNRDQLTKGLMECLYKEDDEMQ
jgi:hypothetical protein